MVEPSGKATHANEHKWWKIASISFHCPKPYARIRLRGIFVIHDGHHVRLLNHSAINTHCVLDRRLVTRNNLPKFVAVHVDWGGGARTHPSWLPKRSRRTRWRSSDTSREHHQRRHWCSSIIAHYKSHSSFPPFTGNEHRRFVTSAKSYQSWVECVPSNPGITANLWADDKSPLQRSMDDLDTLRSGLRLFTWISASMSSVGCILNAKL